MVLGLALDVLPYCVHGLAQSGVEEDGQPLDLLVGVTHQHCLVCLHGFVQPQTGQLLDVVLGVQDGGPIKKGMTLFSTNEIAGLVVFYG